MKGRGFGPSPLRCDTILSMIRDLETKQLRYERVATQHLPVGAHHVEWVADELGLALTAYILTEDGGPTVTEDTFTTFRYSAPVRPRWMPKFLWKRIPWKDVGISRKVTASVTPKWKYPDASHVAGIGQGVRYVTPVSLRWQDFPPARLDG